MAYRPMRYQYLYNDLKSSVYYLTFIVTEHKSVFQMAMDNLGAELSDIPSCDGNPHVQTCHQTDVYKSTTVESGTTSAEATSDIQKMAMDNLGAELSDTPSCDGNPHVQTCHQTDFYKPTTMESGTTSAEATSDIQQMAMDNYLGAEFSDIPSCNSNPHIQTCPQSDVYKKTTEESGTTEATSDSQHRQQSKINQRTHTEEEASTKAELATGDAPSKAPDSGWAWVVLVGVFFGLILTDGIFWSLGVFLVVWQDQISESITELQWIVSLLVALAHFTGR